MSSSSSSGGATPNINVTPLIDVLLVLLIIFMIIAPLKPARFEAKVPAEPKDTQDVNVKPNPLTLVVSISNGSDDALKKVTLNKEDAGDIKDPSSLTNKLIQIFKERETNGVFRENSNEVERTVFIKAPKNINYGSVVKVIDAAKQAGAEPVGLQIDELSSE